MARYFVVDDRPQMRDAVYARVSSESRNPPETSAQGTPAVQEYSDGIARALDSLWSGQGGPPGGMITASSSPDGITVADESPTLLVSLYLSTRDNTSAMAANGLLLYESVAARRKPEDSLPPVIFYSFDKPDDIIERLDEMARPAWERLEALAEEARIPEQEFRDAVFCQLPERVKTLRQTCDQAQDVWERLSADVEAKGKYISETAAAACERASVRLRHQFSPLRRPVVRILLGAAQCRQVTWEQIKPILEALWGSEADSPRSERALNAICNYPHDLLPNIIDVPLAFGASGVPLRYLVLDDETEDATYSSDKDRKVVIQEARRGTNGDTIKFGEQDSGWGAALACLFGAEVVCRQNFNAYEAEIPEESVASSVIWDAVLLDYSRLEAVSEIGGIYLSRIKNRQFDLPILMFTEADDSAVAKWCLSHGASAFYVKERQDQTGRTCTEAYESLRDVLSSLLHYADGKRELWRNFVYIEAVLEKIEQDVIARWPQQRDNSLITWNLRQAFYWLFQSDTPLGGSDTYFAATHPIEKCAARASASGQNAFERLEDCYEMLEGLKPTSITTFNFIYKKAQAGVAHQLEITLQDAALCLNEVLCNINLLLNHWTKSGPFGLSVVPPEPRLLEVAINEIPTATSIQREGHDKTATLGASELIEGLRTLCVSSNGWQGKLDRLRNRNLQVLLVDQNADKTGWITALQSLCGKSITDFFRETNRAHLTIEEIDLILVASRLPMPHKSRGDDIEWLQTLRKIRDMACGAPVFLLTARNDAHWTYKALRRGAMGYLLKRSPLGEPDKAAAHFLDIFNEISLVLKHPIRQDIRPTYINLRKTSSIKAEASQLRYKCLLDDVYSLYLQDCFADTNPQEYVDLREWVRIGLFFPRYTSRLKNAHLPPRHASRLAFSCGQLLEHTVKIVYGEIGDLQPFFKRDARVKTISKEAQNIVGRRNDAAHGRYEDFDVTDHVKKTLNCIGWLLTQLSA